MTAAKHDFVVEQGTTWRRTVEYKNPDGTPFVLTGWTARMQVRVRHASSGTPLLDLTIANGGVAIASNVLTLLITAVQSTILPVGRAVYDLEIISPAGEVTRLIEGSIIVEGEVTR